MVGLNLACRRLGPRARARLEGAFRQARDVKDSSERGLASQREQYEERLRAAQSVITAERSAHEDTRRALEKEQA